MLAPFKKTGEFNSIKNLSFSKVSSFHSDMVTKLGSNLFLLVLQLSRFKAIDLSSFDISGIEGEPLKIKTFRGSKFKENKFKVLTGIKLFQLMVED